VRSRRPARCLPTPDEIASAPELAILAAIEAAADLAIVALVAAQPELRPTADRHDAVTTVAADAADRVIASAQALAVAIGDYRLALCAPAGELPF
jgi:hypothetical protein